MPTLPAPTACSEHKALRPNITRGVQPAPAGNHSDSFPKDMHNFFHALDTLPLSFGTPLPASSIVGMQGGWQLRCQCRDYLFPNALILEGCRRILPLPIQALVGWD